MSIIVCNFVAKQNQMRAKLSPLLPYILFSGLAMFSYLLLVNTVDIPDNISESLYSIGSIIFFVLTFNIVGHLTIKVSSWMNAQYASHLKKWKTNLIYIAVMLVFLGLNYGLLVCAKILMGASHPFTFPNGGVRILIIVWLIELVILGLIISNKTMKNSLALQKETAKLQDENNKAKYAALQSQLNPHFLFNSLNTLIAEIEYNPSNAVGFTRNLSDVYRYVLQCQERPLVTISDELDFIRSYLFLHEVRLGNCINCDINIEDNYMDALIPPLTLQLLFENVIKHNSISTAKPMKISVLIEVVGDLSYLVVVNDVNKKISETSSGIGLKNLSERCKLMLGRDIVLTNDDKFTVKIPLQNE